MERFLSPTLNLGERLPHQPVEPTCPECGHPISEHNKEGCMVIYEYSEGVPISGCDCEWKPADLQPAEPKCEAIHCDKPATETLVSSVFPSLTFNLCKEHAKSYLKTGGQPEAERQVSRDFSTIEHEVEMPLIERDIKHLVKHYWRFQRTKDEFIESIEQYLEAHDSAVALKAIKDAKEALECAEYAFLHPISNQEFALNAVQQALAHIRAMAEEK